MREISAEMDATMKDGSHRKFALCQDCLIAFLDSQNTEGGALTAPENYIQSNTNDRKEHLYGCKYC